MRIAPLVLLLSCLTSFAQGFSQSIAFKGAARSKAFELFDDFSIPVATGSVTNSTNAIRGALGNTARIAVDARGIMAVEQPVPIWTLGDSKTDAYYWQTFITDFTNSTLRVFEYPSRLARTGWTLSQLASFITNYLAVTPDVPAPAVALIDIGANDVIAGAPSESYMKTNYMNMMTLSRAKWPGLKFGLVKIWRNTETNSPSASNCTNWGNWVDQLVSSNSYCFVGPDQKTFITNSTYSTDKVHPDTYVGQLEWGNLWRTNLIANGITTPTLPLGLYFRYNTNNPSGFNEQTFTHTTNSLNTSGADAKIYRWRMLVTCGLGIGTAEQFRLTDVAANNWSFQLNSYEGANTNTLTLGPWYAGPMNQQFDFYMNQLRGYNFQFMTSNGIPRLMNINYYSASGNNFKWTLTLKNVNVALYQVAYPVDPWLPSVLAQDNFNNTLVTDGKAFNNIDYKDYLGNWWQNGTNITWTTNVGTWTTATNTIKPSAIGTNAIATVPGVVDVSVVGLCGTNAGLVARFTDTNNFIYTRHTGQGGNFELHCMVAGVDTTVRSQAITWVNGSTFTRLNCVGDTVTASHGASQTTLSAFTITNAVLLGGTNVGVQSQDTINGVKRFGAYAIFAQSPSTPFGTR